MTLREFMEILRAGIASFTIIHSEIHSDYHSVDEVQEADWYSSLKNKPVSRITTIGGGCDPVETIIELGDRESLKEYEVASKMRSDKGKVYKNISGRYFKARSPLDALSQYKDWLMDDGFDAKVFFDMTHVIIDTGTGEFVYQW